VSAQAGWYPDPGGGLGLYRYWDGRAWSAATSPNPTSSPPPFSPGGSSGPGQPGGQAIGSQPYGQQGRGTPGGGQQALGRPGAQQPYGQLRGGQQPDGQQGGGQPTYGQAAEFGNAYANYQATKKKKAPYGWWLGALALLVVIVLVAVFVVRGLSNGGLTVNSPGAQGSQDVCPRQVTESTSPLPRPADGRVHGGPVSYPELGSPWSAPQSDDRVPFGTDVASQIVTVEQNYQPGNDWVASVLVGELQAGDGFYTPQQGAQIVVKCILGAFYGNNEVNSNVKVNKATKIDGHDAWIVESQLSFNITNLITNGELLIVAIVATGSTAGLFYASIPNTTPQLVQPARDSLRNLKVDG
jgi:hypothetical protein